MSSNMLASGLSFIATVAFSCNSAVALKGEFVTSIFQMTKLSGDISCSPGHSEKGVAKPRAAWFQSSRFLSRHAACSGLSFQRLTAWIVPIVLLQNITGCHVRDRTLGWNFWLIQLQSLLCAYVLISFGIEPHLNKVLATGNKHWYDYLMKKNLRGKNI